MSSCSACGQALTPTAKFCTGCGQPVQASTALTDAAQSQAHTARDAAYRATPEPAVAHEAPAVAEESAGSTAAHMVFPSSPTSAEPEVIDPVAEQQPHTAPTSDEPHAAPIHDATAYSAATAPRYPDPSVAPKRDFDTAALAANAGAFAGQARAHAGATLQRVPLPQEQMTAAARDGLILLGGSVLVFTAFFGLLDLLGSGINAPLLWLRAAVALLAVSVRSSLSVEGNVSAIADAIDDMDPTGVIDNFFALADLEDASLTFALLPIGLTALVLGTAALIARRSGRAAASADTRSRAIRALITGATFGAALALCTVLLGYEQFGFRAAANPISAFIGGTILVGLATFAGLGVGASPLAKLPRPWARDVRTAGEFTGAVLGVALTVLVGTLVYAFIKADGSTPSIGNSSFDLADLARSGSATVVGLVALPSLLILLGAMVFGIGFTSTAGGTGGFEDRLGVLNVGWGILEGGLPAKYLLGALALCLVAMGLLGLRAATRHSLDESRARIWQPALLSAVLWIVLAWTTSLTLGLRVTGSGEGEAGLLGVLTNGETSTASATIGLSLLGATVAAALWTGLAALVGRRLAGLLGGSAPRALAAIGGRHMDETWQVAVTDAILRRGQTPPKYLAGIADGLRGGSIAPPTSAL